MRRNCDIKRSEDDNYVYRGAMRLRKHTFNEKLNNFLFGIPLTFYEPEPKEYLKKGNWRKRK